MSDLIDDIEQMKQTLAEESFEGPYQLTIPRAPRWRVLLYFLRWALREFPDWVALQWDVAERFAAAKHFERDDDAKA